MRQSKLIGGVQTPLVGDDGATIVDTLEDMASRMEAIRSESLLFFKWYILWTISGDHVMPIITQNFLKQCMLMVSRATADNLGIPGGRPQYPQEMVNFYTNVYQVNTGHIPSRIGIHLDQVMNSGAKLVGLLSFTLRLTYFI